MNDHLFSVKAKDLQTIVSFNISCPCDVFGAETCITVNVVQADCNQNCTEADVNTLQADCNQNCTEAAENAVRADCNQNCTEAVVNAVEAYCNQNCTVSDCDFYAAKSPC